MPLITFLGIVYQQALFTSIIVLNVLFRAIVNSTQVIKKVVLVTLFSQNNSMKLWLLKKKRLERWTYSSEYTKRLINPNHYLLRINFDIALQ